MTIQNVKHRAKLPENPICRSGICPVCRWQQINVRHHWKQPDCSVLLSRVMTAAECKGRLTLYVDTIRCDFRHANFSTPSINQTPCRTGRPAGAASPERRRSRPSGPDRTEGPVLDKYRGRALSSSCYAVKYSSSFILRQSPLDQ